ncbi:MAG: CaiB/BaiF CoA transferase family protein [Chromatocurvus sp.]
MGPLHGYTIIELAGIGPAPMGGMILADMGAEVIRVDRAGAGDPRVTERVSGRGKKSIAINLKDPDGVETLLRILENADVLIDPFRPGVCEKLGLSPEVCLERNPRLIFARMTGWGQRGPLAHTAGHDINYISLAGALYAVGPAGGKPVVPLNLVGDMGGGGMLLVNGILAALLEASSSGQGQAIDVAMVDGTAQSMWMFHSLHAMGVWNAEERGVNMLDGGAHFYDTYACADGEYLAVGAIEPQFYAQLCRLAQLPADTFEDQNNAAGWPGMKAQLADIFMRKSRDEWCTLFEGSDACVAPVLRFTEAPDHPANREREVYIEVDGVVQPAPAPRFGRTPSGVDHGVHGAGEDTHAVLEAMGFGVDEIAALQREGAVAAEN